MQTFCCTSPHMLQCSFAQTHLAHLPYQFYEDSQSSEMWHYSLVVMYQHFGKNLLPPRWGQHTGMLVLPMGDDWGSRFLSNAGSFLTTTWLYIHVDHTVFTAIRTLNPITFSLKSRIKPHHLGNPHSIQTYLMLLLLSCLCYCCLIQQIPWLLPPIGWSTRTTCWLLRLLIALSIAPFTSLGRTSCWHNIHSRWYVGGSCWWL